MRTATQIRLAVAAAALGIGLFVAGNVHLFTVAFQSQPACALPEGGPAPARPAC